MSFGGKRTEHHLEKYLRERYMQVMIDESTLGGMYSLSKQSRILDWRWILLCKAFKCIAREFHVRGAGLYGNRALQGTNRRLWDRCSVLLRGQSESRCAGQSHLSA